MPKHLFSYLYKYALFPFPCDEAWKHTLSLVGDPRRHREGSGEGREGGGGYE